MQAQLDQIVAGLSLPAIQEVAANGTGGFKVVHTLKGDYKKRRKDGAADRRIKGIQSGIGGKTQMELVRKITHSSV